ncbi:Rha family transcriptional regulator [Cytobacillus sp.]|uniref:Rha family transcriptional regulator n=1 Tax=Cytobacillus sp. TaxID=2675269 RepID=UPI0028BF328B|nr:Rha family transcriptional regulator [Cytobacillus sp.]
MIQLVFIENNKAVTDSLTVAEVFKKEHARVMRDIRELGCSEEFRVGNFAESTYVNTQNKEMPKYSMSKKGFTLLAMGYTGKEAMKFKEAYIEEFERMESQLKAPRILSDREQLLASMKMTLETSEKVDQIENKIISLEQKVDEQITLTSGEQRRLQKGVAHRVYEFTQDKQEAARLFREVYREIKDRFGVASYKDVKRRELQSALLYIENWIPRKVS